MSTQLAAQNFTRLNYDKRTYEVGLRQSTGPSSYVLGTPWFHCQPCLSADPRQPSGQGVSTCTSMSMVDVDSELKSITRKLSRSPEDMYIPCDKPHCAQSTPVVTCAAANVSEDTRLSNPPCTLRSTGWNRWEWLCKNPQDRVQCPFDFNINSQLIVRDAHRPILPIPVDPALALPAHDDAPLHPAAQAPYCDGTTVHPNLPLVSWRSCDEISRY